MGFENGIITKWNDEKGYGFIKPDSENSQIFVHITAFGRIVRQNLYSFRNMFWIEGKLKIHVPKHKNNLTPSLAILERG